MSFQYFDYGEERRYSFLQVPKLLLEEPEFKTLSGDAKLLYSLMLERGYLSRINGWYDERGHPFIFFTVEEVMRSLSIGRSKAIGLLSDLEKTGLILRVRQGLGKPNRIYVGRFYSGEQPADFKKYENQTSGSPEINLQEVRKSDGNKTDKSQTEKNHTDLINQMDPVDEMRAFFDTSCGFEALKMDYPNRADQLEEIRELLAEVCTTTKPTIRISGEEKPAAVVIGRLKKLNSSHICYVMDCLGENTTKISNIRQYLLAVLYNAPVTISHYYQTLVSHDMAQGLV